MDPKILDPQTLYRNVIHVLENGQRTSTYKLATTAALVDISIKHRPTIASGVLDVPLAELARGVIGLYWNQLKPFHGTQLRQSTQPKSRIFDEVEALRSAADCPEHDSTFEAAAKLAPGVFRRVVDEVSVCLAQQPLPRLQRTAGSAKSFSFLYDDSFLHDNVTRAALARHRFAIQLKPGVAHGLAVHGEQIRLIVQNMWVDDVLRINRLDSDERPRIEEHLFCHVLRPLQSARTTRPPADPPLNTGRVSSDHQESFSNTVFATRLNRLIAALPDYSSGEVAAKIRQSGFPMTVSTLTQLQAGVGPAPSIQTIKALAGYFGVDTNYFSAQVDSPKIVPNSVDSPKAVSPTAITPELIASLEPAAHSSTIGDDETWAQAINDSIDEVADLCQIQDNGCWIGPFHKHVRCRARGDSREPLQLPKLALHRWAWMVDNGYSSVPIPSHAIKIRRSCADKTCCNPRHLFAAAPGRNEPLSKDDVANLLSDAYISSTTPVPSTDRGSAIPDDSDRAGRLVLQANVASIRNYCTVDRSGCWMAPGTGPVACRAEADNRPDDELPMLAFHRWVWMVVHGYSSSPLPGKTFYVRRRCGKDRCCHPEHLYLTTPKGRELTPDLVDALLKVQGEGTQEGVRGQEGGHHRNLQMNTFADRKSPSGKALFSARLNKLFETNTRDGIPHTSSDVAEALQEDGLAVSESLIERLRSPAGDVPNEPTIEALAYFFDVDPEYFSAGTHSLLLSDATAIGVEQPLAISSTERTVTSDVRSLAISRIELGRVVSGLSEVIAECLGRNPAQTQAAGRLLSLLADVGVLLSAPRDDLAIGQALLQQIVGEWDAVARDAEHQVVISRLSQLANGV
jgi:hypothetical protein